MLAKTTESGSNQAFRIRRASLNLAAGAVLASLNVTAQATCAPGFYQPAPGICTISPKGTYSPPGATAPILAAAGTYIPVTGAWSSAAAIAAPLGYYVPTPGASAPTIAPKGYYVPFIGATAPIAAAAGTYISITGAKSSSAATACPSGTNSYGAAPACRIVSDAFAAGTASIGPSFSSSLGAPDAVLLGDTGTGEVSSFSVSNASHDLGYTSNLTSLTLLSYSLSGADAARFTLVGFTAGQVLGEGQSTSFQLVADSSLQGSYSVTLSILTDQHANFGLAGQSFNYAFSGTAPAPVPEPATWASVLIGLITLAVLRRRHLVAVRI